MRVVSGQVLQISTHGVTAINITHFGAGKKGPVGNRPFGQTRMRDHAAAAVAARDSSGSCRSRSGLRRGWSSPHSFPPSDATDRPRDRIRGQRRAIVLERVANQEVETSEDVEGFFQGLLPLLVGSGAPPSGLTVVEDRLFE